MKNTVFVLWLGLAVADIGWAQNEPYKNPDLSPRERAEDLVKRLTLKEKASLMINSSPAVGVWASSLDNWWSRRCTEWPVAESPRFIPSPWVWLPVFDDEAVEAVYTTVSDGAVRNITMRTKKAATGR